MEWYDDPAMRACMYHLLVALPDLSVLNPAKVKDAVKAMADDWRDAGTYGDPSETFVMNWWEANSKDYA